MAPALSYGYEPDRADLIAAVSRRHELARSKAIRAVRELDAAGATVAFESVARAAGVSRSWLYTPPRLRHPSALRLADVDRQVSVSLGSWRTPVCQRQCHRPKRKTALR